MLVTARAPVTRALACHMVTASSAVTINKHPARFRDTIIVGILNYKENAKAKKER